jgi:hypothetical protein
MNFPELTTCILVITAGHVLVGKAHGGADGSVTLYDARTIRIWGTSRGLGQLFEGPLKETVLDAQVPAVMVPVAHIIYALPVNDVKAWWE